MKDMSNFNQEYNRVCDCACFWESLSQHIAGFIDLLKPRDSLTPIDRSVLFRVHTLLYECSKDINSQKHYHMERLVAAVKESTDWKAEK